MINSTVLQGRIVRDPELRSTQSGISVCSFTVAWSEKRGENETKCYLPCTAWRNTGEFINKYFTKGQEIIVRGKLQTREWVDKEGGKRSTIELTVDEASFCGPKQGGGDGSNSYSAGYSAAPAAPSFAEMPEDESELPF